MDRGLIENCWYFFAVMAAFRQENWYQSSLKCWLGGKIIPSGPALRLHTCVAHDRMHKGLLVLKPDQFHLKTWKRGWLITIYALEKAVNAIVFIQWLLYLSNSQACYKLCCVNPLSRICHQMNDFDVTHKCKMHLSYAFLYLYLYEQWLYQYSQELHIRK